MTNVPSDEFWDDLEAEGLVAPAFKPPVVRLERRLTEAREAHRKRIAAERQRVLDQTREVLPNGEILYLDALPRVATPAEARDTDTPDLNRSVFDTEIAEDIYGDVHPRRGGAWPE